MKKRIDFDAAAALVKDGMTIMVGGFLGCGAPEGLIDKLVEKNVKDLTIIANDTSFVDKGVGKLVANGQVKRVLASHIGTNKETGRQMTEGIIDVELIPQGTLAERIRAGGAGLGGVLTPIGIGTVVEEGKQKLTVEGVEYLLETALKADVALIGGSVVDEKGNITYNKTTQNMNPLMATAAEVVIVEAGTIVPVGDIDPHAVVTPGLFVTHIVEGA